MLTASAQCLDTCLMPNIDDNAIAELRRHARAIRLRDITAAICAPRSVPQHESKGRDQLVDTNHSLGRNLGDLVSAPADVAQQLAAVLVIVLHLLPPQQTASDTGAAQ